VEQDVLGLDVAVDHAAAMGIVERGGHGRGDADRFLDRQLALPLEPRPERFAGHVRHDVIELPFDGARVDQPEDMGMIQVGRDLDFLEKPIAPDQRREVGLEDLDGDLAMVPEIVGEINRRHAAGADGPLDPIPAGQSGDEPGVGRRHHCCSGSVGSVFRSATSRA